MEELSMGMSHDFEVAIEEGSTWVRIGTALFGERPKKECGMAKSLKGLKIVFLGAGNMAEALVRGVTGGERFRPAKLLLRMSAPNG